MTSEVNPNRFGDDSEETPIGMEWISKQDATRRFTVVERTLEEWISDPNNGKLFKKRKIGGRVQYLVKVPRLGSEASPKNLRNTSESSPKQHDQNSESSPKQHDQNSESPPKKSEVSSELLRSLSVEISEASRSQREMYERLLKEIDLKSEAEKKLVEQSTQLANLNAERVSFTTAIEKRQDDKKRIERLEKELEELKAENAKLKERKPWEFWKNG